MRCQTRQNIISTTFEWKRKVWIQGGKKNGALTFLGESVTSEECLGDNFSSRGAICSFNWEAGTCECTSSSVYLYFCKNYKLIIQLLTFQIKMTINCKWPTKDLAWHTSKTTSHNISNQSKCIMGYTVKLATKGFRWFWHMGPFRHITSAHNKIWLKERWLPLFFGMYLNLVKSKT